jgi:hypothetical protein
MSETLTDSSPLLADRIFAAIREVAGHRGRLAETGHTDLTGLEDCIRAIYEGVRTAPPQQGRFLVEALVVLQSDLSMLGEELHAACARTIAEARRPSHRDHAGPAASGWTGSLLRAGGVRLAAAGADDE